MFKGGLNTSNLSENARNRRFVLQKHVIMYLATRLSIGANQWHQLKACSQVRKNKRSELLSVLRVVFILRMPLSTNVVYD